MMEDHNLNEAEMLPEYSLPRLNFVVVLPKFEKEVFSELKHIEKLLQDPIQDLPKKELPQSKEKAEIPQSKVARNTYSPRSFFTDGWNALWNFVFGVFAIKYKLLVPLFILYKCFDMTELNIFVDIWEFLIGYVFGYLFYFF
jgi:hypothetical protein